MQSIASAARTKAARFSLFIAAVLLAAFPADILAQGEKPASASTYPESQTLDGAGATEKSPPKPPELPQRRAPAIQPAQSSISGYMLAKPSLSWRQKALRLSAEKFSQSKNDSGSKILRRKISGSYNETLAALAAACAEASLKIESFNSNAGELLASAADGKTRLLFSIWEESEGSTCIAAGTESGNAGSQAALLQQILDAAANAASRRGRI